MSTGELLIIATDKYIEDPISLYAKRWEIETLFGCLKSKGFRFEDTKLKKHERIELLICLLTVTFCIAHKAGEYQHEIKKIKIKKHGRLSKSIFRYGLDYLRHMVLDSRKHIRKKLLCKMVIANLLNF